MKRNRFKVWLSLILIISLLTSTMMFSDTDTSHSTPINAKNNTPTERVVNTTTTDPVVDNIATAPVIAVQPQDTSSQKATQASQQAANEAFLKVMPLFEKLDYNRTFTDEELQILCDYLQVDKSEIDNKANDGRSLKDIIYSVVIIKHGFSEQEASEFIKNSGDARSAYLEIKAYEAFLKAEKLSENETATIRTMLIEGYNMANVISAFELSSALGIDMNTLVEKDKELLKAEKRIDKLLKKIGEKYNENDIKKLGDIAGKYSIDMDKLLQYAESKGISVSDLDAKINDNMASKQGAGVDTFTVSTLAATSSTSTSIPQEDNKYLNPPFDITRYQKAYVNPAGGSFTFQDTHLTLPGRNGLDLSISIKYNSAQAVLNNLKTGSADTYEEIQYNIGAGWSLGFSWLEFEGQGPYAVARVVHLGDGTTLSAHGGSSEVSSTDDSGTFTNGEMQSRYRVTYKDGKKEYFGGDGRLLGITDRYGNKITFKHTIINNHPVISEIADTLGRVVYFTYHTTATAKELCISAPGGKTIRYISEKLSGFDNEYVLNRIIDTNGRLTKFAYNIDSAMIIYPESSGIITTYYANMTEVVYPTSAYKKNYYMKISESYGDHYRVQTTVDVDKDKGYNRATYVYPGTNGNGGYSYAQDMDGNWYPYFMTVILYDNKTTKEWISLSHLKMQEEVSSNSGNYISSTQYQYYCGAREPRPQKIVTTTYNPQISPVKTVKTVLTTYNEAGDILDTTDELGNRIVYTYDPNFHVMTSKTWTFGNQYLTVNEEYNVDPVTGNVTWSKKHYLYVTYTTQWNSKTEAYSTYPVYTNKQIYTEYQYDTYGNMTAEKIYKEDGSCIQKNYEYDSQYNYGYLTRKYATVKDYNGISQLVEEKYTYDLNTGNMLSYTDANNNITSFQYDNLGRATLVSNPDTTTISVAYDDVQNIATLTDENTYQKRHVYDGFGKLTNSEEFKDGAWVSLSQQHYDTLSNMDWIMDANNNVTIYQYDDLGRLKKTINPDSTYTTVTYDDGTYTKTETSEDGNNHYYYYNLKGNLKKEATIPNPSNPTVQNFSGYAYDVLGNVISVGYYNGGYYFNRDALGRLTSVRNAANSAETKYEYDVLNNITKQTVPNGGVTQYFYDELGRLIKTVDPLGKTEYRAYDGAGNLTKLVDRKGQTTILTYDVRNRLKTKTVGIISVTYNYDNVGNITSIIDNNGTTSYEFYPDGKLKKETSPDGRFISYEYDNNGNRIKMTDHYGKETTYTYDCRNRLITVTIDGLTTQYDYYSDGTKKSVTYPGGTKEEYAYDTVNNLSSIVNRKADGTVINQYSYTYDVVGNQLSKSDATGTTSFTYDGLNRINTVTEPNGIKTTYGYDKNNNTTSKSMVTLANVTQETVDYTYDLNDRLSNINDAIVSSSTVKTFTNTYDDNGNLINENRVTKVNGVTTANENMVYGYNELNLMKDYTATNGTITTFAYNQRGLRKSKTTGSNTTAYYYDGDNVVIETLSGALSARNIRGTSLIGRQDNLGITSYYLFNGHGDVVNLVDATGAIKNTYDYDIYGKKKVVTENGIANPARYAGEYYDDESGMYYLRARYYDPEMMRFISEDTNKGKPDDPLSLNLYMYCNGNPIRYYDPTGNDEQEVLDGGNFGGGCVIRFGRTGRAYISPQGRFRISGKIGTRGASQVEEPQVSSGLAAEETPNTALSTRVAGKGFASPALKIDDVQFGAKVGKHAQDFGLDPSSAQSRQWVKDYINKIFNTAQQIRQGTWRGLGELLPSGNRADGNALFYKLGNDVVVTDMEGNFVTILKDGATQNTRFQNATIIVGE